MVEPITIATLTVMAIVAINSTGFSMSLFIPWVYRKLRHIDSEVKWIPRSDSDILLAVLFSAIEEKTAKQWSLKRLSVEAKHPGGLVYLKLPCDGYQLIYDKYFFVVETTFTESGLATGINIIYDTENAKQVIAFIDSYEKQISDHYAKQCSAKVRVANQTID